MNKIIIVHYEEDPDAVEAFEMAANKLWQQHVNYTRQTIISILAGLGDTSAVVDRLMKNQEDIGNAIAPYYGTDAATELTRLLKEHITIAADIIKSIKDSKNTVELEATWQSSAEAIARFLSTADSDNWPYSAVLDILTRYAACTIKQVNSRFNKEWVEDMAAYEQCCYTINELAEAFYKGILNKFPEEFVMQRSLKTIKKK